MKYLLKDFRTIQICLYFLRIWDQRAVCNDRSCDSTILLCNRKHIRYGKENSLYLISFVRENNTTNKANLQIKSFFKNVLFRCRPAIFCRSPSFLVLQQSLYSTSLKMIYTLKIRRWWTFQQNDLVFNAIVPTSVKFDSAAMGISKFTLSFCRLITKGFSKPFLVRQIYLSFWVFGKIIRKLQIDQNCITHFLYDNAQTTLSLMKMTWSHFHLLEHHTKLLWAHMLHDGTAWTFVGPSTIIEISKICTAHCGILDFAILCDFCSQSWF